ncbi:hypothetical protein Ddye_014756 [Dipteronia dyeriana]|uniref:FLZ-type domain-containing protein n=1 Tax=Dipteronia dyeriana TaxID=168575 RepID=A0AAD9X8K9_9ROSI|nr:hypothetical protein Ddye_014756 [Dipteronia dyeriana]
MSDSASGTCIQSDKFGLRKIGSSIFGIVGLSSKGSSDSDSSAWSPTSPLDFRNFVNLSNPFSRKFRKCSTQNCHQKRWNCSKVGLGLINSLAEENKSTDGALDSLKRKTIVFGPQVKLSTLISAVNNNGSIYTYKKSNSLPRNYIVSPKSLTKTPNLQLGSSNGDDWEQEDVHLEPKPYESFVPYFPDSSSPSSCLTGSADNQDSSSKTFYSAERTVGSSAPVVIDRGVQVENYSSGAKSSSLPAVPIGTGQGFVGSLSAREIALSEDYTCITCHGPNPKTTHIFGDCILEGPPVIELANFDRQGVETPQVAKRPTYPSDDFLRFCYLCYRKLERGADIYMYRGEKAFCSIECREVEILAEEEAEECSNSSNSDPGSSYNEDIFIMGLPTIA